MSNPQPQCADEWPTLASVDESYVSMVVDHVHDETKRVATEVERVCAACDAECDAIEGRQRGKRPA